MSWGSRDGGRTGEGSDSSGTGLTRVPAAPRSSDPAASQIPTPWTARPVVAAVVRTIAFLAPFAIAVVTAWGVSRLLPAASTWEWAIARIVTIVVATVAMVILAKRAVRRLGPLSALLRLSAAFPDDAPNRFRLAMHTPSARHLERVLKGEREPDGSVSGIDDSVASQIVALMSAVSAHHPRTRGHSERVRAYADLIGEELELEPADRERLRWAALLHDVGKLRVPVEILDKSDRPDLTEWSVLEQHPAASAELTGPLRDWLGPWWGGIAEHHERWDGTGYPNRLRGNEITLAGRIVAVADSFETMTEVRSYKQPMSFEAAQEELVASAGTHFDPAVVRAFLGISTSRVRRAAGWAAWLPGPIVETAHTVITATSVAGPAGVAATAAVSLIVPGLASEVVQGPADGQPQRVEAAEVDTTAPATVEISVGPASTVEVTVPTDLADPSDDDSSDVSAAESGVGPAPTTTPAAITTTATTSTAPPVTTVAATTTSVAQAAPVPPTTVAPGTTVISPVTSPPITTVPPTSAPATQPTTSTTSPTSPTTAPTTTAPGSTTSTTAVTPPPRWVGTPSFSSSGRTIFASGIEVEGWGLAAMCRLWLPDVPGFVETDIPCSTLMSVLAPDPDTTYRVRLQARTSAGQSEVIEAQVTTGS